MKDLLVLTTAGRLHLLQDAVKSLKDPLDILVVDDATPVKVGIKQFCKDREFHFIGKPYPRGLTNSWNQAFQFFMKNGYKRCILSNDDVRFPEGFSKGLLAGLKQFTITCPISNRPTTDTKKNMFKKQWLFRIDPMLPMGSSRTERDSVQRILQKRFKNAPYSRINTFNGFCFAFSRSIEKFQYSPPEHFLFNHNKVNTGNEMELGRRIRKKRGKVAICRTSYVWHLKNGTYRELKLDYKDRLWTWKRGEK